MSKIIGRIQEIKVLLGALESNKSELIAVYGRRRVGKTFLIRNAYKENIKLDITGLHNSSLADQLSNFMYELSKQLKIPGTKRRISGWLEAFHLLEMGLDKLNSKKKKVIFFDEFPWLDTQRSKLLTAFENFWNSYVSKRSDLVVVICGSAASYMVQQLHIWFRIL